MTTNIPAGWALVPLELTDEMLIEWVFQAGQTGERRRIWAAILAVAPKPIAFGGETS